MDYRANDPNFGARDPSAFLWNQLVSGEPVLLGIDSFRSPVVRIKDQILNAAFRNTFDKRAESASCFMLGNVQLLVEGDGIAVVIDQFCTDTVTPSASSRLQVPYKFKKGQSSERPTTKEDYLARIEEFHNDWVQQNLEFGASLECAVSLVLTARTKGPSCNLVAEAFTVDLPLRVVPLFAIPVIRNAVYESLRLSRNALPDFGFITLCGERLCLFAKNRLKEADLNFIGIWVSGIHSVQHPYVWWAGAQFLSNVHIASRLSGIFLIALFPTASSSVPGQALFYNCICTNVCKPRYQLWRGCASTSVSRVPTTTNKVITMALEKVACGKSSENFEWAAEEFAAKCSIDSNRNTQPMQGMPRRDATSPNCGTWPQPSAPIANVPINTNPSVPDVSFYGSSPYYQQSGQPAAVFPAETTDFSQRSTIPLMSPTERNFGMGYSPEQLQYQAMPLNYPSPPLQYAGYAANNPLPAHTQHAVPSANSSNAPHFLGATGTVASASSPAPYPPTGGQNAPQFPANKNVNIQDMQPPGQQAGNCPRERLPSDGSPGASPEVYELIRRQDQQLSELKMQIQLLLEGQRRKSIGEGDGTREQNGSPRPPERLSVGLEKEQHTPNASDASTMTETASSPPRRQPPSFDAGTQTDDPKEGSRCTLCGRCSPPRTLNHASPQMLGRPYEDHEQDDKAYTLFFPEKAQKKKGGRARQGTANAFHADQRSHSTAVKRGGHVPVGSSNPCSAISVDNSKGYTYGSPHQGFESSQHTVSFCEDVSVLGKVGSGGDSTAKSTLETFIHPRLKYQTLHLNDSSVYRSSGSDLSFQANCIAQKYCTSAKNFGAPQPSPAALGERKKKGPQGLLKHVLEQEAQKKVGQEVFSEYEESNAVSFATREYLKNYGLLDDGRQGGWDDDDEEVDDRVLNISELKKLPKLL
ncbi:SCL-interrupting locus protein homolog [Ornithodoros turicata]|uniref:SCL-interrupting locus protein homolog n=1 Tax=Ornithodoros turicata TaxID=34597 RepID=UPI0031390489